MPTRFRADQIVAVRRQFFNGKIVEDETWRVGFYVGRTRNGYRVTLFPTWPQSKLEATSWAECVPVQDIWPALRKFNPTII